MNSVTSQINTSCPGVIWGIQILLLLVLCTGLLLWIEHRFIRYLRTTSKSPNVQSITQEDGVRRVWMGIPNPTFGTRSCFNPSMVYHHGEWKVIARYTPGLRISHILVSTLSSMMNPPWATQDEYIIQNNQRYQLCMILYTLNERFENKRPPQLVYASTRPRKDAIPKRRNWRNGEDPRIFVNENDELVIQATIHKQGNEGQFSIAHGHLHPFIPTSQNHALDRLVWEVDYVIPSRVSEKNWSVMPTERDGMLFLRHCSPWNVVRLVHLSGSSRMTDNVFTTNFLCRVVEETKHLRCTSAVVPYTKKTSLTCLHTFGVYYTVLCEIDDATLLPIRLSKPIQFVKDSYIEFPSGLAVFGDHVYVALGINDLEARIYRLDREQVNKLLWQRIPNPIH